MAENLSVASLTLIYEGKNVTGDLTPLLDSFTYTDKTEGEADELELTLMNDDDRWINGWHPSKGDTIAASITQDGQVMQCGKFEVDEISGGGSRQSGSTVTLRCIAAGFTYNIRSKKSHAHENKTLRQIVQKVADEYGFKVNGIVKDFSIGRVNQYNETDMAFLHRLADKFGYVFSLRDKTLVFTHVLDLHSQSAVDTIVRQDNTDWTFKDKVSNIYNKARHRHHNKKNKKLYDLAISAGIEPSKAIQATLEVRGRVDNDLQSEQHANGKLYKANEKELELTIGCPGKIIYLAGNCVNTQGFGVYDQKYIIAESSHTITKGGGYTTGVKLRKTLKQNT